MSLWLRLFICFPCNCESRSPLHWLTVSWWAHHSCPVHRAETHTDSYTLNSQDITHRLNFGVRNRYSFSAVYTEAANANGHTADGGYSIGVGALFCPSVGIWRRGRGVWEDTLMWLTHVAKPVLTSHNDIPANDGCLHPCWEEIKVLTAATSRKYGCRILITKSGKGSLSLWKERKSKLQRGARGGGRRREGGREVERETLLSLMKPCFFI